MHAGITHQTFELFCRVDQLPDLCVTLVRLLQRWGFLQRVFQLDVECRRHHLRDAVDIGVWNVHGAAHVLDRRLCRHGAEGYDLCNIFPAVFLRDVIDNLPAPVHAEIHVDVRHRNALGI